VAGVDLTVNAGEVFGLLGPNGAGKTTTLEMIEGLTRPDAGEITIAGLTWERNATEIRARIGVQLQATSLYNKITPREALDLFGSYYPKRRPTEELLELVQLQDKADSYHITLSGGQAQRLALALALVNDPQMLFLDEPSAGLAPQARLEIHALMQELRREQRTVLLTTHYIEEAEKLCDRVAIVDEGRIVAMGTPDEIRSRTLGQARIEVRCERPLGSVEVPAWPEADAAVISADRTTVVVRTRKPARTLVDLVRWIDQIGVELADVQLRRPSLEDVFIELTGKSLRE